MGHLNFFPNIERRLSTWVDIQEKKDHHATALDHFYPTITISRQFGCEAYPLAEKLLDIFTGSTHNNWNIYDRSLLEKVSKEEKLSVNFLENLGSPAHYMDKISTFSPNSTTHDEAYSFLVEAIRGIAQDGNAIIVGRGGSVITKEYPNSFHFRLEASEDFRVASIARRLGVTEQKAMEIVKINQDDRERFIEDYLKCDINDISHYDMVFNNEKMSINDIAQCIAVYVRHRLDDRGQVKR